MKELVATQPFKYGTRMLTAGDPFFVRPSHARVLIAIGKAREALKEPEKPKEPEAPQKKKRASSRRKKSDE